MTPDTIESVKEGDIIQVTDEYAGGNMLADERKLTGTSLAKRSCKRHSLSSSKRCTFRNQEFLVWKFVACLPTSLCQVQRLYRNQAQHGWYNYVRRRSRRSGWKRGFKADLGISYLDGPNKYAATDQDRASSTVDASCWKIPIDNKEDGPDIHDSPNQGKRYDNKKNDVENKKVDTVDAS